MADLVKRVVVTGAAGNIAYSLLFRLAHGEIWGKNQPIALHLLDLPEMEKALEGVKMELDDCAFPLLHEVRLGSDPYTLFQDVDLALLIGAKPRGPGMERKDLLQENGRIFIDQGKALNEVAKPDVKVFVVGNPCNTNCLIALHHAPRLSRRHFFAMTRLDQNRATFQLAQKSQTRIEEVSNVTIWGNHSSTQVPDFFNAKIHGLPVTEVIYDRGWLENDFISTVQKRGAAIINARGKSSAASAAQALIDAIKDVLSPTVGTYWYSMGVYSEDNPYGLDRDLVFSFPCQTQAARQLTIVPQLPLNEFLQTRLKATEKELLEERDLIKELIKS